LGGVRLFHCFAQNFKTMEEIQNNNTNGKNFKTHLDTSVYDGLQESEKQIVIDHMRSAMLASLIPVEDGLWDGLNRHHLEMKKRFDLLDLSTDNKLAIEHSTFWTAIVGDFDSIRVEQPHHQWDEYYRKFFSRFVDLDLFGEPVWEGSSYIKRIALNTIRKYKMELPNRIIFKMTLWRYLARVQESQMAESDRLMKQLLGLFRQFTKLPEGTPEHKILEHVLHQNMLLGILLNMGDCNQPDEEDIGDSLLMLNNLFAAAVEKMNPRG
jgi:hypothetical protein